MQFSVFGFISVVSKISQDGAKHGARRAGTSQSFACNLIDGFTIFKDLHYFGRKMLLGPPEVVKHPVYVNGVHCTSTPMKVKFMLMYYMELSVEDNDDKAYTSHSVRVYIPLLEKHEQIKCHLTERRVLKLDCLLGQQATSCLYILYIESPQSGSYAAPPRRGVSKLGKNALNTFLYCQRKFASIESQIWMLSVRNVRYGFESKNSRFSSFNNELYWRDVGSSFSLTKIARQDKRPTKPPKLNSKDGTNKKCL